MGGGVFADPGQDLGLRRETVKIAEAELDATRHEMDVGVLERGQDHAAGEVDDAGRVAAPFERLGLVADEEDLAAGYGQRLGAGPVGGQGDDRRVRQNEVGRPGRASAAAGRGGQRER